LTDRIQKMKAEVQTARMPICSEKIQIFWEVFQKYGNTDPLVWRAKYQAELLKRISIHIEDGDLICGTGASKPYGLETDYEYGIWTREELEMLLDEDSIFTVTPEDLEIIVDIMEKITADERLESMVTSTGKIVGDDPRLWPFMRSGVTLPPWKDKVRGSGGGNASSGLCIGPGAGLCGVEYDRIMAIGARGIIDEAKQKLKELRYFEADAVKKRYYLEGVIEVFEAWITFAHRHVELAQKMAAECEDETRRAELLQMAEICSRIPEQPCQSFRDAVQMFWFTFLMLTPFSTAAGGRFDQYMYPYYKADIDAGKITKDEVIELLELLRIKSMKLNGVSGSSQRKRLAGNAKWYNYTCAGLTPDGRDATNELSYLLLEAAIDTKLPHNTLTIRVNENTPEDLMIKGLECVRTGIGMPAFVSDKSYISYFTGNGMAEEDARNFILTGCLDGNVPGLTRTISFLFFVIPLVFDIFRHNGYLPRIDSMVGIQTGDVREMKTFEEFKEAFYKQLDYMISLAAERGNIECSYVSRNYCMHFVSALMHDGLELGPMRQRKMEPFDNGGGICMVGGIDVADALTAVKKLVYDEKKYTMDELCNALDANWEGYDEMRQDFAACPKYGNDNDEADATVADLYAFFDKSVTSYHQFFGGNHVSAGISISAHQPGGEISGALPNGRFAGECLTDGCMSPERGCDKNGPLAVFKSGMKVDQDPYQATLLNMKFHPSALKTDADLRKLSSAIRTYLCNGGRQVQFNVVSREQLEAAQANPQEYADLVVRVAGYSTYFTSLSAPMQEEVKNRTAFDNV